MKRHLAATFVVIALVAVVNFAGLWLFGVQGSLVRFVQVTSLDEIEVQSRAVDLSPLAQAFPGHDPVTLLTMVMNSVAIVEDYHAADPIAIYRHVQQGGGLICDGMASLYSAVLQANGFQTRRILLRRHVLDSYDAHETVEVQLNGKWVVFDPTFNVSYERDGELLSAQEISKALLAGSASEIKPRFYGEVKYPARLESYYISWMSLFDNVFIASQQEGFFWRKLPPFRFWTGPAIYYEGSRSDLRFLNTVYVGLSVILPLTWGPAALAGALTLVVSSWRRRIWCR